MTKTLVIIPALNEERSISKVVDELRLLKLDVLVVDDGSKDKTRERAVESGAIVLSLPFNLGVGGALRTGFKFAVANGYDAIIQVDADGQHLPAEVEKLLKAASESDADLIIGSRFISAVNNSELSVSLVRRSAMKLMAAVASKATGTKLTDTTSGFRLIRNPLLTAFSQQFATNYLGDTFEALIAAGRAGYRVQEVPVDMQDRLFGVSSASLLQAVAFFFKAFAVAFLRLQPRIPARVADLQD